MHRELHEIWEFSNPSINVSFILFNYNSRSFHICLHGLFEEHIYIQWNLPVRAPDSRSTDRLLLEMCPSKTGTSVTWAIWKRPVGIHLKEVLLYLHSKLMCIIFHSINRLIIFFLVLPKLKLTKLNLLYRSVTKYEPFLSSKNDLQCTTSCVQN
jgi:hypothetical protein